MITFWTENNKLYTYRSSLVNWEGNLKIITQKEIEKGKELRTNYLDLDTFLVMPIEGDADHLLVLGGNTRNLVDEQLGKEKEAIELIDFKQGEDGKFYPVTNIAQQPDGTFSGDLRSDVKGFETLKAAMTAYSMLHNGRLSGYNPDDLINAFSDPELGDVNINDMFIQIGDPLSLADWADKKAPVMVDESTDRPVDHPMFSEQDPPISESLGVSPETPQQEKPTEVERFGERLVKCPDCSAVFDPQKHKLDGQDPNTVS